MKFSFWSATSVVFLGASFLCSGARADELASRSPFLPSGSAASGSPTENAPLELRGIISSKHGDIFGLYDPSKKESVWVGLNDTSSPFVVRSHDAANDTVVVDYEGRVMTLPLKAAKIESMGPVPNPAQVATMPHPMAGPNSNPMVTNQAAAAEEARRLESVAAEVRRRRMLRAAAQQAGQPFPGAGSPPMPAGPVQPGSGPMPPSMQQR